MASNVGNCCRGDSILRGSIFLFFSKRSRSKETTQKAEQKQEILGKAMYMRLVILIYWDWEG